MLFQVDLGRSAEHHYQRAMELYPRGWPLYLDVADRYRLAGECDPAIHLYSGYSR